METVLVTGVGGGAGQSILKALNLGNYNVIAADSSALGAGLYFGNKSYLVPNANEESYVPEILKICIIENVSFIFPGHDVELKPLSMARDLFSNIGVNVIVSNEKVIDICDDKMETTNFLKECGLNFPKTYHFQNFVWADTPVVLKPQRGGARSRNTYIAYNKIDYFKYSELIDKENCIVQEFIDGPEYTCGTIFLDKEYLGSIIMQRILRDGDTYKAFSVKDALISEKLRYIIEKLKPSGACNIQLRKRGNEIYVFEINARCSGTTAARALVGFNEPITILNYLTNRQIKSLEYKDRTILRYWNEIVIENDEVEYLRNSSRSKSDE